MNGIARATYKRTGGAAVRWCGGESSPMIHTIDLLQHSLAGWRRCFGFARRSLHPYTKLRHSGGRCEIKECALGVDEGTTAMLQASAELRFTGRKAVDSRRKRIAACNQPTRVRGGAFPVSRSGSSNGFRTDGAGHQPGIAARGEHLMPPVARTTSPDRRSRGLKALERCGSSTALPPAQTENASTGRTVRCAAFKRTGGHNFSPLHDAHKGEIKRGFYPRSLLPVTKARRSSNNRLVYSAFVEDEYDDETILTTAAQRANHTCQDNRIIGIGIMGKPWPSIHHAGYLWGIHRTATRLRNWSQGSAPVSLTPRGGGEFQI